MTIIFGTVSICFCSLLALSSESRVVFTKGHSIFALTSNQSFWHYFAYENEERFELRSEFTKEFCVWSIRGIIHVKC